MGQPNDSETHVSHCTFGRATQCGKSTVAPIVAGGGDKSLASVHCRCPNAFPMEAGTSGWPPSRTTTVAVMNSGGPKAEMPHEIATVRMTPARMGHTHIAVNLHVLRGRLLTRSLVINT